MTQKAYGKLQSRQGIEEDFKVGTSYSLLAECRGMLADPPVLLVKPLLCPPPSLTPHTQQHLPIASPLPSAITHCALATCQLSGTFSQRPLGQTPSANLSSSTFITHPELAISYHLYHYHPGLSHRFFYEDYCLLIGLPVCLTLLQSALRLAACSPAPTPPVFPWH